MDQQRHRQIKELFLRACELEPPARAAFLDFACADDAELRREVERLLDAERTAPDFLDDSPVPPPAERPPSAPREPPLQIGSFRIVRTIAEGGMGIVYEAEQQSPRRRVALKVLKLGFALPKLLERFELEADVLARLQHPGIAQIFEAGTAEILGTKQPYFAMELIDGSPLTAHANANRLRTDDRLDLFVQVCDAVHHAHQKGVIHRDLKPANILVTAAGQPKVLDFGIARAADSDVQLTTMGADAAQIIGTLPYMSPEQAAASTEQVDVRSDVYGLGVVLYELLTGHLPYEVSSAALPSAIRIICEQPPRRLSTVDREFRGDLETIVGKALEKDRERRYGSADALAADVRRHLRDEPIDARPASRLYKLSKFARRNRVLVATASALVVALLAGSWLAVRFALQEREQRRASELREYAAKTNAALAEISAGHLAAARRVLDDTKGTLRDWEWRYMNGRLDDGVRTITGLQEGPWYAGFVHGSNQALAVGVLGDVHLWDLATGDRTDVRYPTQEGEDPELRHVMAISPDGSLVLAFSVIAEREGDARTVAILSETRTGAVVQRFPVDGLMRVNSGSSAIAPGGTHVALAADDGLFVYEVASARLLRRFEDGQQACTFDARGEWLAYSRGHEVRFWDVAAGREARDPIEATTSRIVQELTLSPDRRMLVTSAGPTIDSWDLATGTRLHSMHGGGDQVFNLAFGGGGAFLLSVANGATRLWNPATGALVRTFPSYTQYAGAPCFDATGRMLVVTHSGEHQADGPAIEGAGIRVWDLAADQALVLWGHRSFVYPVVVSPDGRMIASGSFDGEVRVWDADSGRELRVLRPDPTIAADRTPVHSLAFDPRGERLLAAHRSGFGTVACVQVWSTTDGKLVSRIDPPPQSTSIAFSPDGALLLVGDGRNNMSLSVYDGRSLEERATLDAFSGVLAFSERGDFFSAAGFKHDRIAVWRTSTLERAFELQGESGVMSMAFSPDGSRLATGGEQGTLTIWDLGSQRPLGSIREQTREVFAVVFLSSRRVASGGRDGVIRIWDIGTAEPVLLLELRDHTDYVYSLALSPDGERLVSGSGDGSVRIWETHPIGERLAARRRD